MNYLIVINNNQLKIVSDGKKSIMDLHSNKMMNQMQDMLTACMVGPEYTKPKPREPVARMQKLAGKFAFWKHSYLL